MPTLPAVPRRCGKKNASAQERLTAPLRALIEQKGTEYDQNIKRYESEPEACEGRKEPEA